MYECHLHPLLKRSQPILDVTGGLNGLRQGDLLFIRPAYVDYTDDRRFLPDGDGSISREVRAQALYKKTAAKR